MAVRKTRIGVEFDLERVGDDPDLLDAMNSVRETLQDAGFHGVKIVEGRVDDDE